jgi:hypothetical protein
LPSPRAKQGEGEGDENQPSTLPPPLVQAETDFFGSQPMPLQEFWPLQALLADLQALVPLQELMPAQ